MKSSTGIGIAILALALSGCGGGSDSSTYVPTSTAVAVSASTPAPTTQTVTGTVTDGPLTGATVAAYNVQPGGLLGPPQVAAEAYPLPAPSPLATVSTGRTDRFAVEVSKTQGPLIIEVTGGSDKDPVDGQTRPLPQGLRLRAAVPDPSVGVAHVTPFTTIACELALARMRAGTDVRQAMVEANQAVGRLLGLTDLLGTRPQDVTVAGTAGASRDYGLLIAGLTQEAHTAGISVHSLIAGLLRDARDGRFDGKEGDAAVQVQTATGKTSAPLSPTAMTTDLAAGTTTFQASSSNASGGTVTPSTLTTVAQSSGVVSPTPAPYVSPYTVNFTVPVSSLTYDFKTSPRGVVSLESSNPLFANWYDLSAYPAVIDQEFGPTPRQFDVPTPTLPQGVSAKTWMQQRVLAVALQYIGYHYQHHHIPDFDPSPYPNWPWLPVTLGTNSAGIDCSDFSQWNYNFGLGLKLGPASASQDDATNVTLQGGYTQAVTWDGKTVIDIEVPLKTVNGKVPDYDLFAKTLQTGDLLYIHNTKGTIAHVIMWVGSVGSGGDGTPLILDSHDNSPPIKDSNGVVVPAGVHLRPFRATEWYYTSFVEAHRIIK